MEHTHTPSLTQIHTQTHPETHPIHTHTHTHTHVYTPSLTQIHTQTHPETHSTHTNTHTDTHTHTHTTQVQVAIVQRSVYGAGNERVSVYRFRLPPQKSVLTFDILLQIPIVG